MVGSLVEVELIEMSLHIITMMSISWGHKWIMLRVAGEVINSDWLGLRSPGNSMTLPSYIHIHCRCHSSSSLKLSISTWAWSNPWSSLGSAWLCIITQQQQWAVVATERCQWPSRPARPSFSFKARNNGLLFILFPFQGYNCHQSLRKLYMVKMGLRIEMRMRIGTVWYIWGKLDHKSLRSGWQQ